MRSARPSVPALAPALLLALAPALGLVAACKPDPVRLDAGPPADAYEAPWWTPAPGEAASWDIQLADAPFDVSAARAMYAVDLFDAVPAGTTLDYGGAPLALPTGAHADAIAALKARTPAPIVVCVVGTGSIRLDDPDAAKFTTEADPPNRPAAPAAGSIVGWSTTEADATERFLDLGEAARAQVEPLIAKRLELAKQIGCDAVAGKHNDSVAYQGSGIGHGFADLTIAEYQSWTASLTAAAHARELSVGMWNGLIVDVDGAAQHYDWVMEERCAEYESCDPARPFLNLRKAVFAIEYDVNEESGNPNNTALLCQRLGTSLIEDGIIKSAALSSAVYEQCP